MEKESKWEKFREKLIENLVSLLIISLLSASSYGVIQIFLSDLKLDKFKMETTNLVTDEHNSAITREGHLLKKICEMEVELSKQQKTIEEIKNTQLIPFTLRPIEPEIIQPLKDKILPLNPAQQILDYKELHNQKYQKN